MYRTFCTKITYTPQTDIVQFSGSSAQAYNNSFFAISVRAHMYKIVSHNIASKYLHNIIPIYVGMDQEIFHCAHTLTMVYLNIYTMKKRSEKKNPYCPILKNLYWSSYIYTVYIYHICMAIVIWRKHNFLSKDTFFLLFIVVLVYGVWDEMRSRSIVSTVHSDTTFSFYGTNEWLCVHTI